jgi:hypothetical protein
MTKAKRFNIIQAIHHPDLFGSLPALHSLQTWTSWITWLKAVFALPMDEKASAHLWAFVKVIIFGLAIRSERENKKEGETNCKIQSRTSAS